MSGEAKRTVLVESGIYRRAGGTYAVHVSVGWISKRRSFKTIEEARAWRDEMKASRPKRKHLRGQPDMSAENTLSLEWRVRQIKKAPRSTVIRDGREFTVVHLDAA